MRCFQRASNASKWVCVYTPYNPQPVGSTRLRLEPSRAANRFQTFYS